MSLSSGGVSDSVEADLLGVLDDGLEGGLGVVLDDGLEVGLEDGLEVGLDVDPDKWLLSSSVQCWLS